MCADRCHGRVHGSWRNLVAARTRRLWFICGAARAPERNCSGLFRQMQMPSSGICLNELYDVGAKWGVDRKWSDFEDDDQRRAWLTRTINQFVNALRWLISLTLSIMFMVITLNPSSNSQHVSGTSWSILNWHFAIYMIRIASASTCCVTWLKSKQSSIPPNTGLSKPLLMPL